MVLAKGSSCFTHFVWGLAFVLANNWQFVATTKGFSRMRIKNVTTNEPVRDGCCYYNVTVTWQVAAFNESHILSFKTWLTSDKKKIRNATTVECRTASENSIQYTFARLVPDKSYTAHIEGFTLMQNVTSYSSVVFYVKRTIFYKGVLKTNASVEHGYLVLRWPVEKKYRRSLTPITYNISVCSDDERPTACKKLVWTVCSATYNPSKSSGQVQLYEQNWRKFTINTSTVSGAVQQPLRKSWSSRAYVFSCQIYLGLCSDLSKVFQRLLYRIDYGNGTYGRATDRVGFQKGFLYEADFINVSFLNSSNPNLITAQVAWRFGIRCEPYPALNIRIILKKDGKIRLQEETFSSFSLLTADVSEEPYVEEQSQFTKLTPYSSYTIEFVTEGRSEKKGRSYKSFRTPVGEPVSSPTIQPIVKGVYYCIENERNVTVTWKMPPLESRNGMIENVTLKYYETRNESNTQLIVLPNVKSTTIFGLSCDIEYQVQVRVCVHLKPPSCSPYTKPQVIKLQVPTTENRRTTNGSNVVVWISVGVGSAVVLVVGLLVFQYLYRRKRRTPLESLTEDVVHYYYDGGKTELSQVGDYEGYYNDAEE